jgi:hypothetical protein
MTAVAIIDVTVVAVHTVDGPRPVHHLAHEREALEMAREHLVFLAQQCPATGWQDLRAGRCWNTDPRSLSLGV